MITSDRKLNRHTYLTFASSLSTAMASSVVQPSSILDTSKRGNCSVCGREMPILTDGTVRIHGPVTNRCSGSRKRPASFTNSKAPPNEASLPPTDADNVNDQLRPPRSDKDSQSVSSINPGPTVGKVLKRIPRSSRAQVAKKLSSILDNIANHNDIDAWERLFLFPRRCLLVPSRGGKRRNLSALVNRAVEEEAEGDFQYRPTTTVKSNPDQHHRLAARISSKLEDGDYRGAVKLACSESTFCIPDEKSLNRLQEKHPPPHPDTNLPSFHIPETPPMLEPKDITAAVSSFPSGSANGPDGMYPQHLKDLIYSSLGPVADKLIASLSKFVNLVLAGNVPSEARQFFFGAKLIGLHKANGSIRPIAIGCTLRRLVSKCACASVRDEIGSILFPKQLGFGVSRGIEAAVHAALEYLSNMETRSLVFKTRFPKCLQHLEKGQDAT